MRRSVSTSTFQHNDRVEALWPEDGKWYPAQVLKVKANNFFRIRFDGYVEQYDYQAHQMRIPERSRARGGGGNQAAAAAGNAGACDARSAKRTEELKRARKDAEARVALLRANPETAIQTMKVLIARCLCHIWHLNDRKFRCRKMQQSCLWRQR
jgi:hypothetical protein